MDAFDLPMNRGDAEASAETNQATRRRRVAAAFWSRRAVCVLAVLTVAMWAFGAGVRLRTELWAYSAPVRFQGDVSNGFNWGRIVNDRAEARAAARGDRPGVAPLKDVIAAWIAFFPAQERDPRTGHFSGGLDYPPLRLLAVALWAHHEAIVHPGERQWHDDLTGPMLAANLFAGAAAAAGAFMLVRHWSWRGMHDDSADPLGPRPMFTGLAAALLVWFNAAVLINAHAWPQWDTWLIPCFLWAAYLMSIDRALAAGMLVACAALLKGQMMLVMPLFLLWPMFEGRASSALRFITGFVAFSGVVVSPWLVTNDRAALYVCSVIIAGGMIFAASFVRRLRVEIRVPVMTVGVLLVLWPWLNVDHFHALLPHLESAKAVRPDHNKEHVVAWIGLLMAVVFVITTLLMPVRRNRGVVALLLLSTAVFLSGMRFNGDWSWYELGYVRGTDNYRMMAIGAGNLPALLQQGWGWDIDSPLDLSFGPPAAWYHLAAPLELRVVFRLLYAGLLVVCGFVVARHARRGDPRVLVALATPWVVFFALLPQMHERYFVWAAGISAIVVGVSAGLTLLHFLITALAAVFMLQSMTSRNPDFWPVFRRAIGPLTPGVGWMTILLAAIFLFFACWPAARPKAPRTSGSG